jgi:hypothetical protein
MIMIRFLSSLLELMYYFVYCTLNYPREDNP